METPIDLRDLSREDLSSFLNSFDTVLSDCDGVLWLHDSPLTGALESLKNLQKLGKKVLFVSNNSTLEIVDYLEKFRSMGYNASPEQIIIPSKVILWHLKNIDFQGKALVIGSTALTKVLTDGGIDVIRGPNILEEKIDAVKETIRNIPDVKAVICDFDVNMNWAKLNQAVAHLHRKDVLFLTGALDRRLPVAVTTSLIGVGQFVDILIESTGRVPTECAKPSEILRMYLTVHYPLDNQERCIFIGDSLSNDMKFADLAGFQKLWVGSGVDSLGSEKSLKPEEIPDFYLPELGILNDLINKSPSSQDSSKD